MEAFLVRKQSKIKFKIQMPKFDQFSLISVFLQVASHLGDKPSEQQTTGRQAYTHTDSILTSSLYEQGLRVDCTARRV